MNDFSQRFLFDDTDVRGEMVALRESYAHVLAKHAYPHGGIVAAQVDNEMAFFFNINAYASDFCPASIKRFRAFLGVPIIQRRQLLGVLVVQQRELRQYDESEESFLVTLATQMAAILSQSQLAALFGQYRHTRIRALPASPGVAIAEGWMDATLPLMEQVYEASTLDEALERERLTAALEEAANEFRRYSKRFAAGAQKETAAIFDLYSHLLSDARLRREHFR